MIFKNKNIIKPTAEQLALCTLNENGDTYTIAFNVENQANCVQFCNSYSIERIIFNKDGKTYHYLFSDSLQNLNDYFGTSFTEVGWYVLDFNAVTASKYNEVLEITYSEMLDYGVHAPTCFSLLMQNYLPLSNTNALKLLTAEKYCKDNIVILPVLQKLKVFKNGVYYADPGYSGLERVQVEVAPKLQEKTVIENGTVVADSDYDGLSKVVVNVASGSAIDLENLPEVDDIENPTESSPTMVKYDGQLYLLIKEN